MGGVKKNKEKVNKLEESRIDIGENRKALLYHQVDGICPLCTKQLMYKKNNKYFKRFEVAHIYPLHATQIEKELLKNEEILGSNINDDDNLIALCTDCHTKYDKDKTVEEYRNLVNIKKKLMTKTSLDDYIYESRIEDEIKEIINSLADDELSLVDSDKISYNPKKISDKLDDTIRPLTRRNIQRNINEYYKEIRESFNRLDEESDGTFDLIAIQVKGCYLRMKKQYDNQEVIFNKLVQWVNKKTGEYSEDACKIVVAFFIQNCEVF